MDSLTQLVLGASVGEAVAGKKVGNWAVFWGAVAGTIPDLDVFLGPLYDPITNIEVHRGFSHSLLFWILVPPLLGYLVWKIHRRKSATYRDWTMLFFWGFSTHALLDACTTWGTKLLWPLDYKFAFNNIFVADPIYTLPFVVLLIMVLFTRRNKERRRKYNNLALYITSGYMALTFMLKANAAYQFSSALQEQGIAYNDLDTKPSPLNTVLWYALVDTDDAFYSGYYSILDSKEIQFNPPIEKGHELLAGLEDQEPIQQLKRISGKWYMVERQDDSTLVYTDMRFGQFGFDEKAPFMWKFLIHVDDQGKVTTERKDFRGEGIDMKEAFGALWTRIKGN